MIARLYAERSVVIDSGPSTRRWTSRFTSRSLTASSSRPCVAREIARLFTDRSVTGSSGPRVRRLTATTSSRIFCSSANFPIRLRTMARSFMAPTVSWVRGAKLLAAKRDRALLLLERLLLLAEVPVAHAEGVSYRRLDKGLADERRGDLGLGMVERFEDRRVAAQPALLTLRPGGREHLALEEFEHVAHPRL